MQAEHAASEAADASQHRADAVLAAEESVKRLIKARKDLEYATEDRAAAEALAVEAERRFTAAERTKRSAEAERVRSEEAQKLAYEQRTSKLIIYQEAATVARVKAEETSAYQ